MKICTLEITVPTRELFRTKRSSMIAKQVLTNKFACLRYSSALSDGIGQDSFQGGHCWPSLFTMQDSKPSVNETLLNELLI